MFFIQISNLSVIDFDLFDSFLIFSRFQFIFYTTKEMQSLHMDQIKLLQAELLAAENNYRNMTLKYGAIISNMKKDLQRQYKTQIGLMQQMKFLTKELNDHRKDMQEKMEQEARLTEFRLIPKNIMASKNLSLVQNSKKLDNSNHIKPMRQMKQFAKYRQSYQSKNISIGMGLVKTKSEEYIKVEDNTEIQTRNPQTTKRGRLYNEILKKSPLKRSPLNFKYDSKLSSTKTIKNGSTNLTYVLSQRKLHRRSKLFQLETSKSK